MSNTKIKSGSGKRHSENNGKKSHRRKNKTESRKGENISEPIYVLEGVSPFNQTLPVNFQPFLQAPFSVPSNQRPFWTAAPNLNLLIPNSPSNTIQSANGLSSVIPIPTPNGLFLLTDNSDLSKKTPNGSTLLNLTNEVTNPTRLFSNFSPPVNPTTGNRRFLVNTAVQYDYPEPDRISAGVQYERPSSRFISRVSSLSGIPLASEESFPVLTERGSLFRTRTSIPTGNSELSRYITRTSRPPSNWSISSISQSVRRSSRVGSGHKIYGRSRQGTIVRKLYSGRGPRRSSAKRSRQSVGAGVRLTNAQDAAGPITTDMFINDLYRRVNNIRSCVCAASEEIEGARQLQCSSGSNVTLKPNCVITKCVCDNDKPCRCTSPIQKEIPCETTAITPLIRRTHTVIERGQSSPDLTRNVHTITDFANEYSQCPFNCCRCNQNTCIQQVGINDNSGSMYITPSINFKPKLYNKQLDPLATDSLVNDGVSIRSISVSSYGDGLARTLSKEVLPLFPAKVFNKKNLNDKFGTVYKKLKSQPSFYQSRRSTGGYRHSTPLRELSNRSFLGPLRTQSRSNALQQGPNYNEGGENRNLHMTTNHSCRRSCHCPPKEKSCCCPPSEKSCCCPPIERSCCCPPIENPCNCLQTRICYQKEACNVSPFSGNYTPHASRTNLLHTPHPFSEPFVPCSCNQPNNAGPYAGPIYRSSSPDLWHIMTKIEENVVSRLENMRHPEPKVLPEVSFYRSPEPRRDSRRTVLNRTVSPLMDRTYRKSLNDIDSEAELVSPYRYPERNRSVTKSATYSEEEVPVTLRESDETSSYYTAKDLRNRRSYISVERLPSNISIIRRTIHDDSVIESPRTSVKYDPISVFKPTSTQGNRKRHTFVKQAKRRPTNKRFLTEEVGLWRSSPVTKNAFDFLSSKQQKQESRHKYRAETASVKSAGLSSGLLIKNILNDKNLSRSYKIKRIKLSKPKRNVYVLVKKKRRERSISSTGSRTVLNASSSTPINRRNSVQAYSKGGFPKKVRRIYIKSHRPRKRKS